MNVIQTSIVTLYAVSAMNFVDYRTLGGEAAGANSAAHFAVRADSADSPFAVHAGGVAVSALVIRTTNAIDAAHCFGAAGNAVAAFCAVHVARDGERVGGLLAVGAVDGEVVGLARFDGGGDGRVAK